jgi:hypothetical protein
MMRRNEASTGTATIITNLLLTTTTMCIEKMIWRYGLVSGVKLRVKDSIQLLMSIELCCSSRLMLLNMGNDVKFAINFA